MRNKPPYRFPFARYPALRVALLFIAGILTGFVAVNNFWFWTGCFTLAMCLLIIAEYRLRKKLNPALYYATVACYMAAVVLFGAAWQSAFDRRKGPPSAQLLAAYTWEKVMVKGSLYNIKQTSTGKFQLDIAVDTTVIADSLHWLERYNLRAVFDPARHPLPPQIRLGARLRAAVTVYPLEPKSNPYEFDYRRYLASQDIYTQTGLDSILVVTPDQTWFSWSTWRQKFLFQINRNFTPQTVPLAKALLLGYKNELDREDKIAFSRVGLSHIMAVSGLHVGFILAPFWFLIPFFWSFRWGKHMGLIFLILLLIGYAGLTGFSASVTRASITGGLITYGRLFHKARDSINLTAVAALVILLINPNQLFEIGFQLSFAAVFVILLAIPVIQHMIPARIRFRWYGIPIMVVIVSIVVQLGLYPLLSYYFGEFSLAGPVANALVVPGLTVVVPAALFLLPVSALFPEIGYILNIPCRWFLDFLQWFVAAASSWSWSWIQTPSTGIFTFLIWVAGLFFIASLPIPKLRYKMGIVLLMMLCLQQSSKLYYAFQTPKLNITMLDVGQGDATFITTPSGKHILVDAGRWTPTYNSARYVIIPHLKALGVEKLDAVFLSHPHADHIGGIVELIQTIPIGTIYNSGFAYNSELYKTYRKEAEARHIPVQSLLAGDTVPLDSLMRLFVYGPDPGNTSSDPNEHSLVMELIYGETEFLFTGDAGELQESLLVKNFNPLLDTDFLKVGHHGSRTSSSVSFLKETTPAISAVSLAKINRFNHPHPQAIRHLQASGTDLSYTSLEGALVFTSDGIKIEKEDWH